MNPELISEAEKKLLQHLPIAAGNQGTGNLVFINYLVSIPLSPYFLYSDEDYILMSGDYALGGERGASPFFKRYGTPSGLGDC